MISRISDFFAGIKVKHQLYLIYFAAIFIPVTVIGNYLIYSTRSMLTEHYESQAHADNLRVKSILLDLTSNIYNKAESLASDQELIALLCREYGSDQEAARAMDNYDGFQTLLSQDVSMQKISVYTWNTTLPEGKYIHRITDEIRRKEWFEQASGSVTPFWSEELIADDFGNERLVLCFHTRIFLPDIKSYALLSITVSSNNLRNRIENSSLSTVLWLKGGSFFYCSDKKGRNPRLQDLVSDTGEEYLGSMELDGEKIIGCVSSLSSAYTKDVFYAATLDYDAWPYKNRITGIHIAIILLIILVTSVMIISYSGYFSRRIVSLRETMHEASQGNYNITDTYQGKDEVSEAFEDLNVMIQDILRKEASVYEAQIRTQELENQQQRMEFKMLSSQINPHFLFNTLETIRMRALKAGNREVADAVKMLGKSMRYVLENTTTAVTTLSRELDYIETYLSIQKLRFHDRINYSMRIPFDFISEDYQIMPLLIQPIVENAIIHGLEEVDENGRIIIHIKKKDDRLYIDIFDNGCGMTGEELERMEYNIHFHPKDSSRSIGLSNIYQRIQLCYGSEYGLKIKSKKNCGTLVTMILPALKYERGEKK
ncbi:MAG: sensor histidine kinase [Lachnospiraceae bacterium]